MSDKYEKISVSPKLLSTPIAILLVGVMISGAIFFGLRGSQSSGLDRSKGGQAEVLKETTDSLAGKQPGQQNTQVKTSIDDDAVLGNKQTAKIAIVEFSDYECPFCKRFRDQTLDEIKANYIDTGKAILVYRDLPLAFHEPAASREAMAAECAKDQQGDQLYFQYHDEIFKTSPGNGSGISVDDLVGIAAGFGLDEGQFRECLEKRKFKNEVDKDAADANRVGITGTPGFVVGKLSQDGSVEGVVVSGAQPYSVFSNIIEQQLN